MICSCALRRRLTATPTLQTRRWRWRWLILGLGIAAGLYLSWYPSGDVFSTRDGWDALDHWVFGSLNASLAENGGWHRFWAVANHRGADIFVMSLFGLLMLWFIWRGDRSSFIHRFCMCAFTVGLTFLSLMLSEHVFAAMGRLSPSLVVDGTFRLTETVSDLSFKDASDSTFPGDHGIGLITLATCMWFYAGPRLGIIAVILALPFAFPRLVVGAHWATDILVGSVSVSLVILCVTLATPAQAVIVDTLCRLLSLRWDGKRLTG